MTFCIDIQFDGPTPDLNLGDGTTIEATPERINKAVAAYVRRCRDEGIDPDPPPAWYVAQDPVRLHIAITRPFAPLYRYDTLCGLMLRSGPQQTVISAAALDVAGFHGDRCGNCVRIARARGIEVADA